jgi:hypothetical protein
MEYEKNMFWFLEKLCFHSQSCYFDVFLSYFHYWILILKLVLIR